MKIAFIIDHLRPDGAQLMLRQLVEGLIRRGHEVRTFCLNDSYDEQLLERIRETGAGLHVIGKWRLVFGPGLIDLFRKLRSGGFDIAVTILYASDLVGRPVARMAGVPKIVTAIQTRDEFYSGLQRFLVSQTARFSDIWVLCSDEIREFAVRHESAHPDRIERIYNGIRTADFGQSNGAAKIRDEFGVHETVFLIGAVGRLTHQKGFDQLLSALTHLHVLDYRCLIAGAGEEDIRLRSLAAELGLEDRVIFAGYRRDVPDLLSALDCYIQPSRYEGMPFAVLEAMASGRPIVAAAVDGIKELIVHGEHGLLAEPGDPVELAGCIQAIAADPMRAAVLGAAAREKAARMFDEEAIADRWEALLLRMAVEPAGVAAIF
jgi:glycosyltransferase involved in cell wall biosynthesis